MSPRIPDWKLERLALGELPETESAPLRSALLSDPEASERYEALLRDNARTLEQLPPEGVAREVHRRAAIVGRADAARASVSSGASRPSWFVPLGAGLAIAAVVALVSVQTLRTRELSVTAPASVEAPEETRIKGQTPGLHIYRKNANGQVEALTPLAAAAPGDVLQLRYQAAGQGFGTIVSIDGRGAVTLHWPEREGTSGKLGSGEISLPHAYALDDAPGFERFILVTADEPFAVTDVLDAARGIATRPGDARGSPLPLAPGQKRLTQSSLLLLKAP